MKTEIIDVVNNNEIKYVRMFDVIYELCSNNISTINLTDDVLLTNYTNHTSYNLKSKPNWESFVNTYNTTHNINTSNFDTSWKSYVISSAVIILIHENIFSDPTLALQRFNNVITLDETNSILLKNTLAEQKSFATNLTENLWYFQRKYSNNINNNKSSITSNNQ